MFETLEQNAIKNNNFDNNINTSAKQVNPNFDPLYHKAPKYDTYGNLVRKCV